MSTDHLLDVVDENDNIVRQASREEIHRDGLLHRQINVWLFTPREEIIFQRRALDKDTFPGLLTASIGGHVEIGDSYEAAALKEMQEETGIIPDPSKLIFVEKMREDSHDTVTGKDTNVFRGMFAYPFHEEIDALKIEKGEAIGFEAWPIEKLPHLSEEERKHFIPSIVNEKLLEFYRKIQSFVKQ